MPGAGGSPADGWIGQMSDERQRIEPSMDEILASIRRIIAEDTARSPDMPRLSAEAEPSLVEATPAADGELPDELLLTDMLDDDGSVVSLSEPSPPAPAPRLIGPGEPAAATARQWHEPTFSRAPEEPALRRTEEPALAVARAASQQLMSQERAQASAALLRELVRSVTQAKELSLGGNPTLEALIREALHPLLRDWLDANLPALVERRVRAEIDRVVARAEDDARP